MNFLLNSKCLFVVFTIVNALSVSSFAYGFGSEKCYFKGDSARAVNKLAKPFLNADEALFVGRSKAFYGDINPVVGEGYLVLLKPIKNKLMLIYSPRSSLEAPKFYSFAKGMSQDEYLGIRESCLSEEASFLTSATKADVRESAKKIWRENLTRPNSSDLIVYTLYDNIY